MVTVVPPVVGPEVGENEAMVGAAATKANSPVEVAVPLAVVTEILTVAAAWALVLAVMEDALVTETAAAVVVPNLTAEPLVKPAPSIVTVVPPVVGPEVGENEAMLGAAATKANSPVEVAVPLAVVTEILTVAAAWALVLAVMEDALVTVNVAAVVVPNLISLTPLKPVPCTVTVVPPVVGPEVGENEVMVGRREGYW